MAQSDALIDAIHDAVDVGLESVGILVVSHARENLQPGGHGVRTGRLKGSISYATGFTKSATTSPATAADGIEHDGSENTVLIGSNVEYAPYVEYGTKRQSAQSYLRRAAYSASKDIPKVFAEAFQKALKAKGITGQSTPGISQVVNDREK